MESKVEYIQGSNQVYQTVENVTMNRATAAGIRSNPKAGFHTCIKFDPAAFYVGALARAAK